MRPLALLALCLALLVSTEVRAETCRQALVLALDVSGSVNEREYADQLNGLAAALNAPDVRRALLAEPAAPVHIAIFVWSSRNHQTLVQNWRAIDSDAALDDVIERVRTFQRRRAGLKTALGTALFYAAELLTERKTCWKRTIDVSGDGENNIGATPAEVYALPEFAGVTVNALVVGDPGKEGPAATQDAPSRSELADYYKRQVIRGPDAFAMIAWGYEDYARAMREKLLREIKLPVFGTLGCSKGCR